MYLFQGLDNSASVVYNESIITEEHAKKAIKVNAVPIGEGILKIDVEKNETWFEPIPDLIEVISIESLEQEIEILKTELAQYSEVK